MKNRIITLLVSMTFVFGSLSSWAQCPMPLALPGVTVTNCTFGYLDGAIDITTGLTPGWTETYNWTAPGIAGFAANTEDLTGIGPGNYFLTIVRTGPGGAPICIGNYGPFLVNLVNVPASFAGADDSVCEHNPDFILDGMDIAVNSPFLTVLWSYSGPGTAAIADPLSPNTTAQVIVNGEGTPWIFTLSVTYAGWLPTYTDQVQKYSFSSPFTYAGPDQLLCNVTQTQLQAAVPTPGSGYWTVISGPNTPTFDDITLYNATMSNMIPGTYVLRWNTENGPCTDWDDVTIYNYELPDAIATAVVGTYAGPGIIEICPNETSFDVHAFFSTGDISDINWLSTGTGTFSNPFDPFTTYTLGPGDNTTPFQILLYVEGMLIDPSGPIFCGSDIDVLNVFPDQTPPVITCPPDIVANTDPGVCIKVFPGALTPHLLGSFNTGPQAIPGGALLSANVPLEAGAIVTDINTNLVFTNNDGDWASDGAFLFGTTNAAFQVINGWNGLFGGTILRNWVYYGGGSAPSGVYTDAITGLNLPVAPDGTFYFGFGNDWGASPGTSIWDFTASYYGVSGLTPTYSDNCSVTGVTYTLSGATVVTTPTPLASITSQVFNKGVTTVTYVATDVMTLTASCSFNVTVQDAEPPVALCKDITVNLSTTGHASIVPADVDNGSTDNCGIVTYLVSPSAFDCSNVGPNTVTLSVWDAAGNSASCSSTVTIVDNLPPTLTCPADFSVANDPGVCQSLDPYATAGYCNQAGFAGNFAPANWTLVLNGGNGSVNTAGAPTSITLVGSDAGGGFSNSTDYQITVPCKGYISFSYNYSTVDWCAYWDPFGYTLNGIFYPLANSAPCGSGPGETINGSYTVPVVSGDVFAFSIFSNDNNLGAATTVVANFFAAPFAVTDNCGVASVTKSPAGPYPVGTNTITWTATDVNGLTTTCSHVVTVVDTEKPVISACAPAQNVALSSGTPIVDNWGAGNQGLTEAEFIAAINGMEYSIEDFNDFVACSQPFGCSVPSWPMTNAFGATVTYSAGPIVPSTVNSGDGAILTNWYGDYFNLAFSGDNVYGFGGLIGPATSVLMPSWVSGTVTLTNGSTFNVSFLQTDPPSFRGFTFAAPISSITISSPVSAGLAVDHFYLVTGPKAGACSFVVPDLTGQVDATDNCTGEPSLVITQNPTAGTVITPVPAHGSVHSVTLTVTDQYSNFQTCNTNLTAIDVTPPDITCPSNIMVYRDAVCNVNIDPSVTGTATATDNCSPITITYADGAPFNFVCFAQNSSTASYDFYRTWTATDGGGNTDVCQQLIQVRDTTRPVWTSFPADITISCDVWYAGYPLDVVTATDNCGIWNVGFEGEDIYPGPCPNSFVVARSYVAIDNCTNYNNRIQFITVQDITPPVVTTTSIATCYPTPAAAIAAANAATSASDNCSAPGDLTWVTTVAGTCAAVVTIVVTDECLNATTVTYNTRIDNTPPTLVAGSIATCYPTVAAAEAAAIAATTMSDNCTTNPNLVVAASTTGDCFAVVTVTVTDECSNAASVIYNTRIDNTPPVVTAGTIGICYPTVAAAEAAAVAATGITDNCPGTLSKIASTSPLTCDVVVTVTGYDACGNSAFVTYNTRIDNTPPTLTAGTIATCYATLALAEAAAIAATTATDNCPGTVALAASTSPATCDVVITVTGTDYCGLTSSITYNTRIDNTPPVITAVSIGTCYATVALAEAAALAATSATDNCPGDITETVATTGPLCNATITVTETDACGNSSSITFGTRIDNVPPTITAGSIATCYPTQAAAEAAALAATSATDNCPGAIVETVATTGPLCAATITVTETDVCGNSSSTTYNTRIDNTPPVITCPANLTICTPPGGSTAVVTGIALVATDNCPGTISISWVAGPPTNLSGTGDASGTAFAIGTTTLTYTAVDACGNVNTCSFDITVNATYAANAGPDQQECNQTEHDLVGNDPLDGTGEWFFGEDDDPLTPGILGVDYWPMSPYAPAWAEPLINPGPNQYTAVVANLKPGYVYRFRYQINHLGCKHSDYMYFTNWLPPVPALAGADQFLCNATQTTLVANDGNPLLYGTGLWTYIGSIPAGAPVPTIATPSAITTLVTGLTAGSAGYTYIFNWATTNGPICPSDNEQVSVFNRAPATALILGPNPRIECPQVTSFAVNGTVTNAVNVLWTTSGTGYFLPTNNVSSVYYPSPADITSGSVTLTLTATPLQPCPPVSATVTVLFQDNTPPTISCVPDATRGTTAPNCYYMVVGTELDAIADDNCGMQSLVNNFNGTNTLAGAQLPKGSTTVKWTATDVNGNTSTCQTVVTVVDDDNPVALCKNASVNLDATGNVTITPALVDNGSWDNCPGWTLSVSPNSFTCANLGPNPVTLTITDGAGLTASCAATVTVYDVTPPVAVCKNITVNLSPAGTASIVGADVDGGSTDACGPLSFSVVPSSFTCANLGANTVILTVSDGSSNTATCSAIVTVKDVTPPVAVCKNITVDLDATGNATITGAMLDGGSTDACDNLTFTATPNTFTCANLGNNTVKLTVADGSGNTATCNSIVLVKDVTPPVAVCKNITVNLDGTGNVTITGAQVDGGSTDACGPLSFSVVPNAFDCDDIGTNAVVLTVSDGSGNTATCAAVVTVVDAQPPVITCPLPITVFNDPGLCSAVVTFADATATDNCDVVVDQISGLVSGSPFPVGINTVVYKATDEGGNTATCSFTVTVIDNEPPLIICPPDITTNNDPGLCAAYVFIDDPYTEDNCAVVDVWNDAPTGYIFSVGLHTVKWWVLDDHGNTSSCSHTVLVNDVEKPTITCPADITVNTDPGQCHATGVVLGVPVASDNCAVLGFSINNPEPYYKGVNNVIWTVTDIHGNFNTCLQTVTVVDNQDPVITCPAPIVGVNDPGVCSKVVTYTVTATDNCPGVTLSLVSGLASGSAFPVGVNTVVWMATDAVGRTATCSFTVTITDTQLPTISCPADIVMPNAIGECGAYPTFATPAGWDNCPGWVVTQIQGPVSGAFFPVGTTTVAFKVTDAGGLTATCSFTVKVNDTELPKITCPADVTVNTDLNVCYATNVALGTPTVTDNCPGVTYSNNALVQYPKGVTNVTWTATDVAGNKAYCVQKVTVVDAQKPVITCPADITLNTNPDVCYVNDNQIGTATATDNCPDPITITHSPMGPYAPGTYTVVWTATDGSGNTQTCAQSVTVIDIQAPAITCPPDITLYSALGECAVPDAAIGFATATDNCAVASITETHIPAGPFKPYHNPDWSLGNYIVTWMATDIHGNTSTCEQEVYVLDNQPPVITCSPDITVNTDVDQCFATVTTANPTATDNCDDLEFFYDLYGATEASFQPGFATQFNLGLTYVYYYVFDANLNYDVCSFEVTVVDNQVPVVICPPDMTVGTDADLCTAIVDNIDPVVLENCSYLQYFELYGATEDIGNGTASGHVFNKGLTTVVYWAYDNSGWLEGCFFHVTVVDDQFPSVTCPADVTVNTDAGECFATGVALGQPQTWDNCGVTSVTNDAPVEIYKGVNDITWFVSDAAGNVTTCIQKVTVLDVELPVIACPLNIIVGNDPGECGAVVEYGVQYGDNCPDAVLTQLDGIASGSFFPVGTTTNKFKVTDASGNFVTCEFTVTVNDTEFPSITCPVDVVTGNDVGLCGAAVTFSVGYGDNCPNPVLEQTQGLPSGSIFPVGTTVNKFKVTDGAGNVTTCEFNVTVNDVELPTISCPSDVNIPNDLNLCSAVYEYEVIYDDNCPNYYLTQIDGLASGDAFPVGTTVNIFMVTDGAGNTATCSFSVTVFDNQFPVIVCPNDITVNAEAGLCSAVVEFGIQYGDNCPNPVLEQTAGLASGSAFPVGVTPMSFKVTDAAGNVTVCGFTVTVIDTELPTIECPASLTVNTDIDKCYATVNDIDPVADDNCPNWTLQYTVSGATSGTGAGSASGKTFNKGLNTVKYVVRDASGNTASCSFTILVNDAQPPYITCPPMVWANTNNNLCITTANNVILGAPVVNDNCGSAGLVVTNNAPAIYPLGASPVTWTVVDPSGNVSTCVQWVQIIDVQKPTITCPANKTVQALPGENGAYIQDLGTPTTWDNCIVINVINNAPINFFYPVGTTVVKWTVYDGVFNTNTCNQTVTVLAPLGAPMISGKGTYLNPFLTPMDNTTVHLVQNNNIVATTTTDEGGDYTFNNVSDGTYTIIPSSTKEWGGGNGTDGLLIMQSFIQTAPLTGLPLEAADVSSNNFANAQDAQQVARRFTGQINGFTSGDWVFETPTITVAGASIEADFASLCYGDVNGSFVPPMAKIQPTVTLNNAGVIYINANGTVELPISTAEALKAGAVSLVLHYPADIFEITGVRVNGTSQTDVFYTAVNGTLRMAWFNVEPISPAANEAVIILSLKAKATGNESSFSLGAVTEIADETGRVQFANLLVPKLAFAQNELGVSVYPNPFSNTTTFTYNLPQESNVTLQVFDILGNEVSTLVQGQVQNASNHTVTFDGSTLRQGVYTWKMVVKNNGNEETKSGRLVITR